MSLVFQCYSWLPNRSICINCSCTVVLGIYWKLVDCEIYIGQLEGGVGNSGILFVSWYLSWCSTCLIIVVRAACHCHVWVCYCLYIWAIVALNYPTYTKTSTAFMALTSVRLGCPSHLCGIWNSWFCCKTNLFFEVKTVHTTIFTELLARFLRSFHKLGMLYVYIHTVNQSMSSLSACCWFLGAFALRKVTISFIISVHPHWKLVSHCTDFPET
jgi:hypothetical protein